MIDSLSPLSTSIIATVRRDAVAPAASPVPNPTSQQTSQAGQSLNQSFQQKNTDNVFQLRPNADSATPPQADFNVQEDTTVHASTYEPQQQAPTKGAFAYASQAYRSASSFTAFPQTGFLNFGV